MFAVTGSALLSVVPPAAFAAPFEPLLLHVSDGVETVDPALDASLSAVGTSAESTALSPSGDVLYFNSQERLLPEDGDDHLDVYRWSADAGLTLASAFTGTLDEQGAITFAGASSDDSRVVFQTTLQLTADDPNQGQDLYERAPDGAAVGVSTTSANPALVDAAQLEGISQNGDLVVFRTKRSISAQDVDNTNADLYGAFRDGTQVHLAHDSFGAQEFVQTQTLKWVSAAGDSVIYETQEQLVAADGEATRRDVYRWSAAGGVSIVSDMTPQGTPDGPANAYFVGAGDNGRVAFETEEALLATDTDSRIDVYVRVGGIVPIVLASDDPCSASPCPPDQDASMGGDALSVDGTILWARGAAALDPRDTDNADDVYRGVVGEPLELVSDGVAAVDPDLNALSLPGWIARDGSAGAFTTSESLASSDTDQVGDIYVRRADGLQHATDLPDAAEAATVSDPVVPNDGRSVLFSTTQSLLESDADMAVDHYASWQDGSMYHVSDGAGPDSSVVPNLRLVSDDGRTIVLSTTDRMLPTDTDDAVDLYLVKLVDAEMPPPSDDPAGGGGPVPVGTPTPTPTPTGSGDGPRGVEPPGCRNLVAPKASAAGRRARLGGGAFAQVVGPAGGVVNRQASGSATFRLKLTGRVVSSKSWTVRWTLDGARVGAATKVARRTRTATLRLERAGLALGGRRIVATVRRGGRRTRAALRFTAADCPPASYRIWVTGNGRGLRPVDLRMKALSRGVPLSAVRFSLPRSAKVGKRLARGTVIGQVAFRGPGGLRKAKLRLAARASSRGAALAPVAGAQLRLLAGRRPAVAISDLPEGVTQVQTALLGRRHRAIKLRNPCRAHRGMAHLADRRGAAITVRGKARRRC